MKQQIKTYPLEESIKELIVANNSLSYCSKISSMPESATALLDQYNSNGITHSKDLFPYLSILVSSSWNGNDDVFTKGPLWAARKTPKNHPCNIDHNQTDIVGHITDVFAVDNDYNIIPDNTKIEDLPDLFHLVNSSVLYTEWSDETRSLQISQLIQDIIAGKKYVSMEAVFYDFDYALIDVNTNESFTLDRNENTAYLSKYLRAYGGEGVYDKYKIGRELKDFVFIGKGIVDVPANKYSIIFDTAKNKPFKSKSVASLQKLFEENGVEIISYQKQLENEIMSKELETKISELEVQLSALAAEKATLFAEKDSLASEKDSLVAVQAELESKVNSLQESVNQIQAQFESVTTSYSSEVEKAKTLEASNLELTQQVKTLTEALAGKEIEFMTFKRLNELSSAGVSSDEAQSLIANFGTASADHWELIVKLATKAQKIENVTSASLEIETEQTITQPPVVVASESNSDDQLKQAIAQALKK